MKYTYKISSVIGLVDITSCPPSIVKVLFPLFAGEPCETREGYCLVTFDTPQTPTDLGPLVRVELLPSP
jgi:hypothetical protein